MNSKLHDVWDTIGSQNINWNVYWKPPQFLFWPINKRNTMSAFTKQTSCTCSHDKICLNNFRLEKLKSRLRLRLTWHILYNLRLIKFVEACIWPICWRYLFIKIRFHYNVKQDNYATHYTSEGNVTISCMLFVL